MILLKIFTFNLFRVNAYLIYEPDGAGVVIDPSCMDQKEFGELQNFIRLNNIKLGYQLNTHGHFDHLLGVNRVKNAFHAKHLLHALDGAILRIAGEQARSLGFDYHEEVPDPDGFLEDTEVISAGNIHLKVIHVPGHTQGGVAFYEESQGWLFSGDTLFAGAIGRTDLPGGNFDQEIVSIKNRLMVLPDTTQVFPGHGPASTIGEEKLTNPFL